MSTRSGQKRFIGPKFGDQTKAGETKVTTRVKGKQKIEKPDTQTSESDDKAQVGKSDEVAQGRKSKRRSVPSSRFKDYECSFSSPQTKKKKTQKEEAEPSLSGDEEESSGLHLQPPAFILVKSRQSDQKKVSEQTASRNNEEMSTTTIKVEGDQHEESISLTVTIWEKGAVSILEPNTMSIKQENSIEDNNAPNTVDSNTATEMSPREGKETQNVSDVTEPAKRERGRPRKDNACKAVPDRKTSAPKFQSENTGLVSEATSEAEQSETTSADVKSSDAVQKTSSDTPEKSRCPPKRGRPRKNKALAEDGSETPEEMTSKESKKKSRQDRKRAMKELLVAKKEAFYMSHVEDVGGMEKKCRHCSKVVHENQLSSHLSLHCAKSPLRVYHTLPCCHCCLQFSTKSHLSKHLRVHARRTALQQPDPCDVCGEDSCQGDVAGSEVKEVQGVEDGGQRSGVKASSLVCELCQMVLKDPDSYREHKKTHLEWEYCYQCEFCAKKYRTARDLKYHQRTKHLSAFKYNCVRCGLGLRSEADIQAHVCPKSNPVATARAAMTSRFERQRQKKNMEGPQTVIIFEDNEKKFVAHIGDGTVLRDLDEETGKGWGLDEEGGAIELIDRSEDKEVQEVVDSLLSKVATTENDGLSNDVGEVTSNHGNHNAESVERKTVDPPANDGCVSEKVDTSENDECLSEKVGDEHDDMSPGCSGDESRSAQSSLADPTALSSTDEPAPAKHTPSQDSQQEPTESAPEAGDRLEENPAMSSESALDTLASVAVTHKYACEFCGKRFGSAGGRHKHLKTVHGYKRTKQPVMPSTCVCGKTFTTVGHLKEHIRAVHTDDKDFECDVCHKRFKSVKDCSYHKKTVHLGMYRYYCSTCGKGLHSFARIETHKCNWGEKARLQERRRQAKKEGVTQRQAPPNAEPALSRRWKCKTTAQASQATPSPSRSRSSDHMTVQTGQSQVLVSEGVETGEGTEYLVAFWDEKGELIVSEAPGDETEQNTGS